MNGTFTTNVLIDATPNEVWSTLTETQRMKEWIAEPDMNIEVVTDWKLESTITIRGFHHANFENKGTILSFDKGKKLKYSHLSSLSRLPDRWENYSIIEFTLEPIADHTQLTLDISNFPTESIRKHLEFYWRSTIVLIKTKAETIKA